MAPPAHARRHGYRRPNHKKGSPVIDRQRRPVTVIVAALLLLSVVLSGRSPATAQQAEGVETLTGSLTLTNPLILDVISEPYILLADMNGFVERDR